ncbi:hypothetical protein [Amycolatopsis acidicola]|uniref:hypothetical protein n=1 Tax=Amycolatopsis acidicola TaxID=2596893 RepID=UPI00140B20B4|nr:hypothetical protein [Amycolatopsis acidicola]
MSWPNTAPRTSPVCPGANGFAAHISAPPAAELDSVFTPTTSSLPSNVFVLA